MVVTNPEGGRVRKISVIGTNISGDHSSSAANSGPYMEKQKYRYCQAHAVNASLGYRAIDPDMVMAMAEKIHLDITTATGREQGIRHHFNTGISPGNFSTEIINHFMRTTIYDRPDYDGPKQYMTSTTTPAYVPAQPTHTREHYIRGIHSGSTKEQIISGLGEHTNVILNFTTSSGYGHAACLKKHLQQWYLLDSENPAPINLDKEQKWHTVCGHTYILSNTLPLPLQLDRFNPHGEEYARLSHYISVVSPNVSQRNRQMNISPTASPDKQNHNSMQDSPIASPNANLKDRQMNISPTASPDKQNQNPM
jgi:hypothetical protein